MTTLKLQTPVDAGRSGVPVSLRDRILVLGSCFADSIADRLAASGFDACVNPFGTLYNPVSLCNAAARLDSGAVFTEDECVPMGAGAGLVCSFWHHTSFARPDAAQFLKDANDAFARASAFWRTCNKVLVTLGTAFCYEHVSSGEVVANCLKRDAKEFARRRLSVPEAAALLENLVRKFPEKQFLFTVSPIRHLADGAHGNQLGKSILLLAVEQVCSRFPGRCAYFPAYEIVLDELRDYRFYAEDMCHPSAQTVGYLWSRFVDFAVPVSELPALSGNEKAFRRSRHRPLHDGATPQKLF